MSAKFRQRASSSWPTARSKPTSDQVSAGTSRAWLGTAGQWDEAIAALERAIALDHDGFLAFSGFFVAMAHQKKGDTAAAKEWYDRALAWKAKYKPKDKFAENDRAEAAALLRLKDSSASGERRNQAPQTPK